MLLRIVDRDGNTVSLDWTRGYATAGQADYTLGAVRAPSDESSTGGITFARRLVITHGTAAGAAEGAYGPGGEAWPARIRRGPPRS